MAAMTLVCFAIPVSAQIDTGTVNPHPPTSAPEWRAGLYTDHTLAGQIWLAADNRFIRRDELLSLLSDADLVLLGEKHDNPDHHDLRLGVLQSLLAGDGKTLLVMEMMTQAQQTAVDTLSASKPLPDPASWQALLAWDEGWTWDYYQPAISLALQSNTQLLAGNIHAEQLMEIYRSTESDDAEQVLNAQQLSKLAQDIDISHCGMLPQSQIPAMVRVQQARDQQMASALLSAGEFTQRILLAGNYHIRHDLSIPNYLRSAAIKSDGDTEAGRRILNLAFLEVDPALTAAEDYLADADADTVYDLIWFTPAVQAEDYCADLAP